MPEPGWIPPSIAPDKGECMRQAFACVTGVHPIKMRLIDADKCSSAAFWAEWYVLAYSHRHQLKQVRRTEAERYGYWIAIVPSFYERPTTTHAVAMNGAKLHYDSGDTPRVRRPRKFLACYIAIPLD